MCKKYVMMYKITILLFFVMIVSAKNIYSQGLNNDYPIDSLDVRNIINMLGIEMFKFPLEMQKEECKLRIIQEIYENHKLSGKSVITNGLPDDCLIMNESKRMLRIYKQGINDSTIGIRLDLDEVTISNQIGFDKDTLGMQQCRAYSKFQPVKGKSVPVFIWYSFGKGRKEAMHCPGDSPLKTVVELYDFVIAYSLEIEEIKK